MYVENNNKQTKLIHFERSIGLYYMNLKKEKNHFDWKVLEFQFFKNFRNDTHLHTDRQTDTNTLMVD